MHVLTETIRIRPSKKAWITMAFILGLAGALRCMALGKPYMGNFSSYQFLVASVSRFFLRENFSSWLSPKLDILIGGQPGLLFHYYPVASLLAAGLSAFTGLSLEVTGRFQAIVFSLGAVLLLYAIGARMRNRAFGLITA